MSWHKACIRLVKKVRLLGGSGLGTFAVGVGLRNLARRRSIRGGERCNKCEPRGNRICKWLLVLTLRVQVIIT